jgi:transcription elongation factor Elf1
LETGVPTEEDENGEKHGRDSNISKGSQDIGDVTVTVTRKSAPLKKRRLCIKGYKQDIVRKAREYSSVDQILDDIKAGKIVPYESSEEICNDLICGLLTPVEALMFANALDRYSPNVDDVEDGEDVDLDGESLGFDEDDEADGEEREIGSSGSFSYNPDGFSGSDKFYDEQDWDPETRW